MKKENNSKLVVYKQRVFFGQNSLLYYQVDYVGSKKEVHEKDQKIKKKN